MFPKKGKKKSLSGAANSNGAFAAETPGSSGRSEAALTASNESLSVRRRPSAGKIYKRTLVQEKEKKATASPAGEACVRHTEEGILHEAVADRQLWGVAEVKRRR